MDTGFWIAAFDARDAHHGDAQTKFPVLEHMQLVLPWPTVYETLRTRLVRNRYALGRMESVFKSRQITLLDDTQFREFALARSLSSSQQEKRPFSMVDWLIRLVIDDRNTKIDCLVTFNRADFADICARRRVTIL